jgi:hypothetical protein
MFKMLNPSISVQSKFAINSLTGVDEKQDALKKRLSYLTARAVVKPWIS